MSGQRYAITFRVKPGTEKRTASILSSYGRPVPEVDAHTRLLATTVLMKDNVVVRVIEIDGSMPAVMQHLGRQPGIQAAELAINPFLEETRDLSTPDGARNFFMRAFMDPVTQPAPVQSPANRDPALRPYAVLYRFQTGRGADADACFTTQGETTIFRKDDDAVRFFELAGGADEAIEHLVRVALAENSGEQLQNLLATPADLSNEEGWRRFFTDHMMRVVTYRVAPPSTPPTVASAAPAKGR